MTNNSVVIAIEKDNTSIYQYIIKCVKITNNIYSVIIDNKEYTTSVENSYPIYDPN